MSKFVAKIENGIRRWMEYCSPLQFPVRGSLSSLRDTIYQASAAASVLTFVLVPVAHSRLWLAGLCGIAMYRVADIAIALTKVAVFSMYGAVPTAQLPTEKIPRNTLAVLVNYIELSFWFATVFRALSIVAPGQFCPAVDSGTLAYLLSFSTITTIGYGNVAPAGAWAVALCAYEGFLGLITLSVVIGSLVGVASSRGDRATATPIYGSAEQALLAAPGRTWARWAFQRLLTWAVFVGLCFIALLTAR